MLAGAKGGHDGYPRSIVGPDGGPEWMTMVVVTSQLQGDNPEVV